MVWPAAPAFALAPALPVLPALPPAPAPLGVPALPPGAAYIDMALSAAASRHACPMRCWTDAMGSTPSADGGK